MTSVREFLNFAESSDQLSGGSTLDQVERHDDLPDLEDQHTDEFVSIISRLLETERIWNKANTNGEWCCINELIQSKFTPEQENILLDRIQTIGFARLKEAFWDLNKACNSLLCEPEDLFGIFKRRMFHHRDPLNDKDQIYFIGRYLHLTLMHIKMLKKRGQVSWLMRSDSTKSETISIILPILQAISSFMVEEAKTGKANS